MQKLPRKKNRVTSCLFSIVVNLLMDLRWGGGGGGEKCPDRSDSAGQPQDDAAAQPLSP